MKNNVNAFFDVISMLRYILNGEQKKKAVGVIVSIILGACFELLGVSAILPFMQALLSPDKLMNNRIVLKICALLGINNVTNISCISDFF